MFLTLGVNMKLGQFSSWYNILFTRINNVLETDLIYANANYMYFVFYNVYTVYEETVIYTLT